MRRNGHVSLTDSQSEEWQPQSKRGVVQVRRQTSDTHTGKREEQVISQRAAWSLESDLDKNGQRHYEQQNCQLCINE